MLLTATSTICDFRMIRLCIYTPATDSERVTRPISTPACTGFPCRIRCSHLSIALSLLA